MAAVAKIGDSPEEYELRGGSLVGQWHDATNVCLPGWSCWVAAILDGRRILDTQECDDAAEAEQWVRTELQRRTGEVA